ncbi:hypothetical protein DPMN_073468 [Dreissena polymorpha]|uniref:Uncharacterized protein n=1 Tax=Dreissena polymorpha TaxID=45954 RepID=A0A9D4BZ85_DREPO|nr:hypothetical protein DPMN_073468 [Dreissena polymorpha]
MIFSNRIDVGLYDSSASNKMFPLRIDPGIFITKYVDDDGFVFDLPEQQEINPIVRFNVYDPVPERPVSALSNPKMNKSDTAERNTVSERPVTAWSNAMIQMDNLLQ